MDKLQKWRLVLGNVNEQEESLKLSSEFERLDEVLEALYGDSSDAGLGSSAPKVNRWLGDIRKYFNTQSVQILQRDAFDRLGIERMLLEPELLNALEPDIHLISTLISLKNLIPSNTRQTAKAVVKKVVDRLIKKLKPEIIAAVQGAINRSGRNRRPKANEIDWHKTIRVNLKHYQQTKKIIILEQLLGNTRKGQSLKNIILCVDQSASMSSSVIYSAIFASVLASLPSVKTNLLLFDTSTVDMTTEIDDPVELLFGIQLGGGTDIGKALTHAEKLISTPTETIIILISDLYEGGNFKTLIKKAENIKNSGATFITLLALNDEGSPFYDTRIAKEFANIGIASFACTPDIFPDLMASAIKKEDIGLFAAKNKLTVK